MSGVRIRQTGSVGHITLTRPKAMNALTHGMALLIERALDNWAFDPTVEYVLIDAEGDRAFCAGGDLIGLYQAGQAGDYACAADFWRDEYRLNHKIATFTKPYVALMHGVVMGGGVGISAHGSHRVVTDTTLIAMPECSVGLVPDVGGTHILGNAPGHLGLHLGLTGARMSAADAIYAGFADHYVPAGKWDSLKNALEQGAGVDAILDHAETPSDGTLSDVQAEIDAVYGVDQLGEAFETRASVGFDWAKKATEKIGAASPLCAVLTWDLIKAAAMKDDLTSALNAEFRCTSRALELGDFGEGIRAAIVDKDRNPNWKHKSISDVPAELISQMHSPATGGDLQLQTWEELKPCA
ncbi:MAG: enoyl-CoA hydratase/isomerase family protein [Pseudomonadota bacterium]